jgi:hypothetical protein
MRRGAKEPSTRATRNAPRAVRSAAEGASRQVEEGTVEEDTVAACTDNDLGAQWTGNIDCVENAIKKSRRRSQGR